MYARVIRIGALICFLAAETASAEPNECEKLFAAGHLELAMSAVALTLPRHLSDDAAALKVITQLAPVFLGTKRARITLTYFEKWGEAAEIPRQRSYGLLSLFDSTGGNIYGSFTGKTIMLPSLDEQISKGKESILELYCIVEQ